MSKVTLNNFPNMQILMCSGKNYLETSLFYTNLEYPETKRKKEKCLQSSRLQILHQEEKLTLFGNLCCYDKIPNVGAGRSGSRLL